MRTKQYQHLPRAQGPIVPKAGPLKVIKLDGTIEVRPPLTPKQAQRIIGKQRGRHQQHS